MKYTDNVRTVHFYVAEFGPISPRDLAGKLGVNLETLQGQLRRLATHGHLRNVGAEIAAEYVVGSIPLPPAGGSVRRQPSDGHRTATEIEAVSPLFEEAIERGLDAKIVATLDGYGRVQVPDPTGEYAHAWVDSPADLALVLADLGEAPAATPSQAKISPLIDAGPLREWLRAHRSTSAAEIAQRVAMAETTVRRLRSGEQAKVRRHVGDAVLEAYGTTWAAELNRLKEAGRVAA
jgi:DNA-binding Lrp family transcriptional regulator